jgi:hypothetical protein
MCHRDLTGRSVRRSKRVSIPKRPPDCAILDKEVEKYAERGFRVVAGTDTTAQLVKPKTYSFLWAFIWFLFLIVGLLLYILWYMAKKDEQVYLTVDEKGHIHKK